MYATPADLLRRQSAYDLVQLTNDRDEEVPPGLFRAVVEGADLGGAPTEQVKAAQACVLAIEEAIGDAESEVDSYLATGGYDTPFEASETPRVLEKHTSALAYYELHETPTEHLRAERKDAVAWLKRVATGRVSLGPTDSGEDSPAPSGGVAHSGSEPVFSGRRSPSSTLGGPTFFQRPRSVVGA